MRIVIQRVLEASVDVGQQTIAQIQKGALLFVCIEKGDTAAGIVSAAQKVIQLRYFSDSAGKMNFSITQTGGSYLAVSQFTLSAQFERGLRPSFEKSESPQAALALFNLFVAELNKVVPTDCGVFGADMQIKLVNDGPVTFCLNFGNEK